jgi:hypothetical protein
LRKKVDAFLDENNAAVERLVRASRMEVCHWSGNLERGFHAAVPNLLKIKAATSLLGLKAIEAAERGDMDAAEEALAAQFRLARSLEDEPFLIVQLIRIALVHMCLESLERVTARDECPRSLLVRFQRVLRASEAVESLEHAIIGERAVANSLSRKPTHDLLQMMNLKSRHGQALFLGYNFCGGWAADRLWFLNCYNELLRISRLPPAERLAEGHRLRDAFEPPWYSWLGHMFLLNMYEIQKSEAGGIAGCRAARTALAVLRFHLQKGRAPERLEELVPGYIDSIPVDPFDGAPLRYKRTGDSFAVYSIGEDMTDDGGDEHMDFVFSRE